MATMCKTIYLPEKIIRSAYCELLEALKEWNNGMTRQKTITGSMQFYACKESFVTLSPKFYAVKQDERWAIRMFNFKKF